MVANLHTLINKPWYIQSEYGRSLLPSLFSVLQGGEIPKDEVEDPNTIRAFVVSGSTLRQVDLNTDSGSSDPNGPQNRVIVLGVKSPILKYNQECGPSGTKSLMARMETYANDPSVAGIVLDIDSGGGQVSGTPETHDYIKAYPKPVVTYTDGLLCSAAYYIGAAANHIIANKRADAIGSIGAMCEFLDLKGYYEKLGANVVTMYATKSQEKNKAYREIIESGNTESYINSVLDPIVDTFHNDMTSARPDLNKKVLAGADYSPKKALKLNLIDELGTLQTAVNKVFELSNNNSKTPEKMQSTERPLLQGVLGLEAPLQEVEGHSSLTAVMLDNLESNLAERGQLEESLTAFLSANEIELGEEATSEEIFAAIQTRLDGLSASKNAAKASNQALNDFLQANEIEVEDNASSDQIFEAIQGRINELGSREAGKPTAVTASDPKTNKENPFVDASASHNVLADNLRK